MTAGIRQFCTRALAFISGVILITGTLLTAGAGVVKADPVEITLYVDTTADTYFGDTGETTCQDDRDPIAFPDAVDCTLRGAIAHANYFAANGDTFVIDLNTQMAPGIFYLNLDPDPATASGEDYAMTGDLDIYGSVRIIGKADPADIVIDAYNGLGGESLDRVIDVQPDAIVYIQGVTIQHGMPREWVGVDPAPGGGVRNVGSLTMVDSVVRDNRTMDGLDSPGGYGGGIYNEGPFSATNLTILNNTTGAGDGTGSNEGGGGGGFYNGATGVVVMQNSVFQGNQSGDGGIAYSGGAGGGLYNSGSALLNFVTFDANQSGDGTAGSPTGGTGGDGGAIFNNNQGDLKIVDSLFSLNVSGKGGLGQSSDLNGGTGGNGGKGGAIANSGTISRLQNTTFVSNSTGLGGDCSFYGTGTGFAGSGGAGGAISNSQYGIIGDNTSTTISFTLDTNHTGAGGKCAGSGTGGHGGGLYNEGTINSPLENIVVQNNVTGAGGGVLDVSYSEGGDGGNGGGIYNKGTIRYQAATYDLGIVNATFTGNRTGPGGAGGNGPLSGISIGGNGGNGGAVYNSGTIAGFRFSTFDSNYTGTGYGTYLTNDSDIAGDGGHGGAIYTTGTIVAPGTIGEISYSVFIGNYTGAGGDSPSATGNGGFGGNGGAIALYGYGKITRLFNSTLTQNHTGTGGRGATTNQHRAGGSGGAIYTQEQSWIDIRMSTLVDNHTILRTIPVAPNYIESGRGGGIFMTDAELLNVVGSILSANTRAMPGGTQLGSDCAKTSATGLQSLGFNVILYPITDFTTPGLQYQCSAFTVSTGKFGPDVTGLDPMIEASDPLQYYTPIFYPTSINTDSPAVDLVPTQLGRTLLCSVPDNALGGYYDQRGETRLLGSKCDAGSVEIGGTGAPNGVYLPIIRK